MTPEALAQETHITNDQRFVPMAMIGGALALENGGVYRPPKGPYEEDYQTPYDNPVDAETALSMVRVLVETGLTPANIPEIYQTTSDLGKVYDDPELTFNILGNCHDQLEESSDGPQKRARVYRILHNIADKITAPSSVNAIRGPLQNNKPRTRRLQVLDCGAKVLSFVGNMVHRLDPRQRNPDPYLMPEVGLQAALSRNIIAEERGESYVYAHEALHLPLEECYMRNTEDGDIVSLSSHILWVGERTRAVDSKQIELLKKIKNTVGVKLSTKTEPEDIQRLASTLNPDKVKGKLIFMLRLGPEKLEEKLPAILDAIAAHAPESILQYDVHGLGKDRSVEAAINEMHAVQEACKERGLRLHGVHLEAMEDNERLECRDKIDDPAPPDENCVDPQFNPRQVLEILTAFRDKAEEHRDNRLLIAA